MIRRRRFKQKISLQDRLSAWADEVRKQADQLRPGPARDMLLRQADTRPHLNEWVDSAGLRSPT
jgi:hypothetical protein